MIPVRVWGVLSTLHHITCMFIDWSRQLDHQEILGYVMQIIDFLGLTTFIQAGIIITLAVSLLLRLWGGRGD